MISTLRGAGALAALLLACATVHAEAISFTFDDGWNPGETQADAWNAKMLSALDQANVRAMLFPAGRNVDSPAGLARVAAWGRAGHAIGNHTYSHRSLGSARVTLDEFTADVLKAEALFKPMHGWNARLRFPYLKEGETAAKRDGMREWMARQGYRPAPVSIDTSDWFYSQRYVAWRAAHPAADTAPFRDAYLTHLWNRANDYEKLARDVLGRSPAHVMLLHTNAANADFLPDVLAMFRARGWKIVSAAEAFEDPLYAQAPATLPAGESVLWALAKQANRAGLRYPAEDGAYEESALRALGF